MSKLLKHEFFKVINSKGIKILTVVIIALSIFTVLTFLLLRELSDFLEPQDMMYLVFIKGMSGLKLAFSDISDLSLFIAIIVSILLINEFNSQSFKIVALSSHTRGQIFFSKYIAITTVSFFIVIIQSIIYVSGTTMLFGWGEAFTFKSLIDNIILPLVLGLVVVSSITAFFLFLAFWLKNTAGIIIVAIVLPLVLSIIGLLSGTAVGDFLSNISYLSAYSNYFLEMNALNFMYLMVSIAILLFPSIIGGYFIFQKQEIK